MTYYSGGGLSAFGRRRVPRQLGENGSTVAALEAQYLAKLQSPAGGLSDWNEYRQRIETAPDFPAAATYPVMTYAIGTNREVRLQPEYTPDWQTVLAHTNAESAKQFARERFRLALGVYPENYTAGVIGVTVATEDLQKLTPAEQTQYLTDNPNVVVLPPAPATAVEAADAGIACSALGAPWKAVSVNGQAYCYNPDTGEYRTPAGQTVDPLKVPITGPVGGPGAPGGPVLTTGPDFSDVESGSDSESFPSEDVYGGKKPGGVSPAVLAAGAVALFVLMGRRR